MNRSKKLADVFIGISSVFILIQMFGCALKQANNPIRQSRLIQLQSFIDKKQVEWEYCTLEYTEISDYTYGETVSLTNSESFISYDGSRSGYSIKINGDEDLEKSSNREEMDSRFLDLITDPGYELTKRQLAASFFVSTFKNAFFQLTQQGWEPILYNREDSVPWKLNGSKTLNRITYHFKRPLPL